MTRLEESIRAACQDPRWDLPEWPDPMRRVRRAAARQRARLATAATAVILAAVVAPLALLPGLAGHSPRSTPTKRASAAPVPCHPGWQEGTVGLPAGDHQDRLVTIAGSASDDVWAAGDRMPDPRHVFPLLEHWNGNRWAYSAGASLGGRQAWLTGLAAPSAGDVWTVGYFAPGRTRPEAPLIEHWNGRSWSLRPTLALTRLRGALPQTLASVAALAPDDVWVLGHRVRDTGFLDVYLHWNGASWHLVRAPDLISRGVGSAWMQALGADQSGHLWAVGGRVRGYGEAAVPARGTVERWNGRQWLVDGHLAWRKPLTAVAPVAPGDVWALTGGSFTVAGGGYGVSPVQVLRWDGRAWQVELSLGDAMSAEVTGLAAVSADDAYVTGRYLATKRPFIRHWDGTRWRSVPLRPAGRTSRIGSIGVAVTSDGSVAAIEALGPAGRVNLLWLRCPR